MPTLIDRGRRAPHDRRPHRRQRRRPSTRGYRPGWWPCSARRPGGAGAGRSPSPSLWSSPAPSSVISRSPLLAVQHVRLSGESHTSSAEVLAVTGLDRKPLMTALGHRAAPGRARGPALGGTASVRRHWPTTVVIRLTERTPVAVVAGAPGGSAVLDGTGRVLAVGPRRRTCRPAPLQPCCRPSPVCLPRAHPDRCSPGPPGSADALVLAAALPAIQAASPSQITGIVLAHGTLDLTLSGGGDGHLRHRRGPRRQAARPRIPCFSGWISRESPGSISAYRPRRS